MDSEKFGDYLLYGSPKPELLKFNFQMFYYILCHTIYPLVGAYDQCFIQGILHNTLYAISCGYVFDLEDLFIRILVDAAEEFDAPKVFIPWIQKMVNLRQLKEYLAKEVPEKFIPPVRDTLKVLQDFSKGKVITDSSPKVSKKFAGPQIPRMKLSTKPLVPSQLQICLQLEISFQTQQLLLIDMDQDRKEKEHLAHELNGIHNQSRLIHMILHEDKHHSWKLLRKFFSKKKLKKARIHETYDFMDLPLTADDLRQHCTPSLPTRAPTTDSLRFNIDAILIDESEAMSPTFQSEENVVLPSTAAPEEKHQEKSDEIPASPTEPEHAKDQADKDQDDEAERNAVTSDEETFSPCDSGSSSGDKSSSSSGHCSSCSSSPF